MLYVVYHDPGGDDSKLVEMVRQVEGAHLVKVSEAASISPSADDNVVLLMPMRGGHSREVMEVVARSGASWRGTIPPELTASAIARAAREAGCSSVRLYFWPAKRFLEDQLDDVGRIAAMITLSGLTVVSDGCADCIAPLALLPGKIVSEAEEAARACGSRALGPLIDVAFIEIREWLRELSRGLTLKS
ncbi:hypothetical protein [Acidilobus sp.]|uniref:hypothetical protein n=1 Tax=Acidilobus sp. TaxID=1872109 RepID=UPI003D00DE73